MARGMNPMMSMGESAHRRKIPPKELNHIELKEGEGGGHIATHHFTSYEHQPEAHVFGKGQGKMLMKHLAEHLHLVVDKDKDAE